MLIALLKFFLLLFSIPRNSSSEKTHQKKNRDIHQVFEEKRKKFHWPLESTLLLHLELLCFTNFDDSISIHVYMEPFSDVGNIFKRFDNWNWIIHSLHISVTFFFLVSRLFRRHRWQTIILLDWDHFISKFIKWR